MYESGRLNGMEYVYCHAYTHILYSCNNIKYIMDVICTQTLMYAPEFQVP